MGGILGLELDDLAQVEVRGAQVIDAGSDVGEAEDAPPELVAAASSKQGFAVTLGEQPVEVAAREVQGLEIRLERGATVSGRLRRFRSRQDAGAPSTAGVG